MQALLRISVPLPLGEGGKGGEGAGAAYRQILRILLSSKP